jgi:hypothetical protein
MPVNVEAIDKTVARIRQNQNFKFNMGSWGSSRSVEKDDKGHVCGTSACIAGFAALASQKVPVKQTDLYLYDEKTGEEKEIKIDVLDISDSNTFEGDFFIKTSGKFLGLTEDQARALFLPHQESLYLPVDMANDDVPARTYLGPRFMAATEDQGIAVLEHLKETGIVDWSVSGIRAKDEKFYDAWKLRYGKTFEDTIRTSDRSPA